MDRHSGQVRVKGDNPTDMREGYPMTYAVRGGSNDVMWYYRLIGGHPMAIYGCLDG